jgi:hypothetical protein
LLILIEVIYVSFSQNKLIMKAKQLVNQNIVEPITNAADLWTALNLTAGLDESFYDKDLVEGNEYLK